MNGTYNQIDFNPVPINIFGKCPQCKCKHSKIQWGWHGVYYDMICKNGHSWTYKFNETE